MKAFSNNRFRLLLILSSALALCVLLAEVKGHSIPDIVETIIAETVVATALIGGSPSRSLL